jgi:acetyl esterase/lipase
MLTVALIALCTLLALAPIRRPFAFGVLSLVLGYLLNELPFVFCAYLLVSTYLAIHGGGLDTTGTWAVLGLALLTATGLGVVVRRALHTKPSLEHALEDGLGSDWRDSLDPAMASRLRDQLPYLRIVFGPIIYRRRDVKRVTNVSYGHAGKKNLLDVYVPRSESTDRPILIHLHGGALFMGRKSSEARPLLYRLASQGWLCVSANYRLRPTVSFPDHLVDVKKVIAWARDHAGQYGADPAMIFVSGSSSGAQLAALAALTQNVPAYQPGFETTDTSVAAAICLHGYYGQHDAEASPWSPISYDGSNAPPFFVVHGEQDSLLMPQAARRFTDKLRGSSRHPVVYAELPGAQHGFDRFHSIRFDTVVNAIEAFCDWVISRKVSGAATVRSGGCPT